MAEAEEAASQASSFWAFSLDRYARPGIQSACLDLQDTHGADVNMLLFALWSARRGRALTQADWAALEAVVAPWRHGVIQPLRASRRALKPPPGAPFDTSAATRLRTRLLEAELEAERLQQSAMAALAGPPGTTDPAAAARANLASLAAHAGLPPDAPGLATLRDAV